MRIISSVYSLALIASSHLIANNTLAAGFDCSKASTLVEETICGDSELSSLDDDLNEQYGYTLGHNNISTANRIKREGAKGLALERKRQVSHFKLLKKSV